MQKLVVDKWWARLLILIVVPTALGRIESRIGTFSIYVVIIIIVVRSSMLKRSKKAQVARDSLRTKAKIDAEINDLQERVTFYSTYKQQPVEASPDGSFVFQADEHAIAIASEVGLIESRTSEGVAEPTLIDEGKFVITDKRGIFVGTNETREFVWSKLVQHQAEPLASAMVLYLSLSNRQKVSGIGADEKSVKDMQQRIEFAVAVGLEREAQFLDKLKTQIAALKVEMLASAEIV